MSSTRNDRFVVCWIGSKYVLIAGVKKHFFMMALQANIMTNFWFKRAIDKEGLHVSTQKTFSIKAIIFYRNHHKKWRFIGNHQSGLV